MERDYFYILEYSDNIKDIREQFPLLPQEDTISIANELGLRHPKNPETGEDIVMIKLKNWPFEKGKKVQLIWIGEPFKENNNISEKVLDLYFNNNYKKAYLKESYYNQLAWIISNKDVFKMINSIGYNSAKMLEKFYK